MEIVLPWNYTGYIQRRFVRGNPKVSYQLSLDEDAITMDYLGKEAVLPITETENYFILMVLFIYRIRNLYSI